MSFPLNIFFYFDKDIPDEIVQNVLNYKRNNLEFNVQILNDKDIDKYYDNFPELIKLFHLITISALKADIFRLVILYMEGGMYIDSNTTLINKDGIKILFEKYKDFDFVFTIYPSLNFDLCSGALLSKKKSKLAYDTLNIITKNLKNH